MLKLLTLLTLKYKSCWSYVIPWSTDVRSMTKCSPKIPVGELKVESSRSQHGGVCNIFPIQVERECWCEIVKSFPEEGKKAGVTLIIHM